MSEVRVNNIVDYGGKGAPTFDNGAVISGVSSLGNQAKIGSNVTITSGGINVSGVTTAATLSGNLTGDVNAGFLTATSTVIGSGVTINAGGLNITGVCTATTFEGSGANMTGVAMTIAPLVYNPDPSDTGVIKNTGIGITFDHRILAGSGNITLSVATNAGAAGTVVENFGVGSSVTIAGRRAVIDPTNNLTVGDTYHINYPSGCFTNTGGDVDYVGTAYTFGVADEAISLWSWGDNNTGWLGINNTNDYSSPVQIPGTTWSNILTTGHYGLGANIATKSDGTAWVWGYGADGRALGLHPSTTDYSSPVQLPGTTWNSGEMAGSGSGISVIKTDGTLWSWGANNFGALGVNNSSGTAADVGSPVQIYGGGTTWSKIARRNYGAMAIKSDGTMWGWGRNQYGEVGTPGNDGKSSPVQIPGTTWSSVWCGERSCMATKTDGTLWGWGRNSDGWLGQNNRTDYASPVQVPGTTWSGAGCGSDNTMIATKTDGTLWAMGSNHRGQLGQNSPDNSAVSSPVQVGSGTDWSTSRGTMNMGDNGSIMAIKTDGTMWAWGTRYKGNFGDNSSSYTYYSSPVQVPCTGWSKVFVDNYQVIATKSVVQ